MKKLYAIFTVACLSITAVSCSSKPAESPAPKAAADAPKLSIGDKEVSLEKLKALTAAQVVTVTGLYKHEHSDSFVGFPLVEVLTATLGEDWKKADGLLFTALDGYKMDIPVAKILKYDPILVYRFQDPQQKFSLDKGSVEGAVDLGPYYLVWNNVKYPELIKQGLNDWPYQVAKIETILYSVHYAKVFPFKKFSRNVKQGFEAYKSNCMACHALNNEGGLKAAQLWPYPPVVKMGKNKFSKWILNPQKSKPGTTMPPLNTELDEKDRKRIASEIFDYLAALNKRKPPQAPVNQ